MSAGKNEIWNFNPSKALEKQPGENANGPIKALSEGLKSDTTTPITKPPPQQSLSQSSILPITNSFNKMKCVNIVQKPPSSLMSPLPPPDDPVYKVIKHVVNKGNGSNTDSNYSIYSSIDKNSPYTVKVNYNDEQQQLLQQLEQLQQQEQILLQKQRELKSQTSRSSPIKTAPPKPKNTEKFGRIEGVYVGKNFEDRRELSDCGVHTPTLSAINGIESRGCFSITMNGCEEGVIDLGNEITYTGSYGKQYKGDSDQQLTSKNLMIAKNCYAFNKPCKRENQEAHACKDCLSHWREGQPIRIVRGLRLGTNYAPKTGYRYDGLYKVVDYWTEKGKYGFNEWKFLLRRDDPENPTWTVEGLNNINFMGLGSQKGPLNISGSAFILVRAGDINNGIYSKVNNNSVKYNSANKSNNNSAKGDSNVNVKSNVNKNNNNVNINKDNNITNNNTNDVSNNGKGDNNDNAKDDVNKDNNNDNDKGGNSDNVKDDDIKDNINNDSDNIIATNDITTTTNNDVISSEDKDDDSTINDKDNNTNEANKDNKSNITDNINNSGNNSNDDKDNNTIEANKDNKSNIITDNINNSNDDNNVNKNNVADNVKNNNDKNENDTNEFKPPEEKKAKLMNNDNNVNGNTSAEKKIESEAKSKRVVKVRAHKTQVKKPSDKSIRKGNDSNKKKCGSTEVSKREEKKDNDEMVVEKEKDNAIENDKQDDEMKIEGDAELSLKEQYQKYIKSSTIPNKIEAEYFDMIFNEIEKTTSDEEASEKIKKYLSCEICCKVKKYVILRCTHRFCLSCLTSSQDEHKKSDDAILYCPKCHVEYTNSEKDLFHSEVQENLIKKFFPKEYEENFK